MMMILVVVIDLMIKEELEDRRSLLIRYNRRMIFDLSMSLSLHMSYKIGIMVDESIEIMGSRFHINDELLEIVQHTMQLQTILYVE